MIKITEEFRKKSMLLIESEQLVSPTKKFIRSKKIHVKEKRRIKSALKLSRNHRRVRTTQARKLMTSYLKLRNNNAAASHVYIPYVREYDSVGRLIKTSQGRRRPTPFI